MVYDFGIKWNILRLLSRQDMELLVVPPSFTCEQVKAVNPDGVFLSNGPGDPATLKPEIAEIAKMAEIFPIGAICLGHQLLGPRPRRHHHQAEVRPPRREPSGQEPAHRPH